MYYTGSKEPFTHEEAGQELQLQAMAKPQKFMIQPCVNQAAFESHIANSFYTLCSCPTFSKTSKSYILTLCCVQELICFPDKGKCNSSA